MGSSTIQKQDVLPKEKKDKKSMRWVKLIVILRMNSNLIRNPAIKESTSPLQKRPEASFNRYWLSRLYQATPEHST